MRPRHYLAGGLAVLCLALVPTFAFGAESAATLTAGPATVTLSLGEEGPENPPYPEGEESPENPPYPDGEESPEDPTAPPGEESP